jgi:hypothetical protein
VIESPSGTELNTECLCYGPDELYGTIKVRPSPVIGNLTSQLFANEFLDSLDLFVVETLAFGSACLR